MPRNPRLARTTGHVAWRLLLNRHGSALEAEKALVPGLANGNGTTYRSTRRRASEARRPDGIAKGSRQKPSELAFHQPDKLSNRSWWEYVRGYHVFFPCLWRANGATKNPTTEKHKASLLGT